MEKYLVYFMGEDIAVQFPLDYLLRFNWNNYLDRSVLDAKEPHCFPIKEAAGQYLIFPVRGYDIFVNDFQIEDSYALKDGDIVRICHPTQNLVFRLLSLNHIGLKMNKYVITNDYCEIGSAANSHISLDYNMQVSPSQAVIFGNNTRKIRTTDGYDSGWLGVYVNNKRVKSGYVQDLYNGDFITVAGITMVYFNNTLLVPSFIRTNSLQMIKEVPSAMKKEMPIAKTLDRYPRIIFQELTNEPIVIDSPPAIKEENKMPFILQVGPSLTMAFGMVAQIALAFESVAETGNYTSIISRGIMAGTMLIGAIMWPMLSRSYMADQADKKESHRRKRYMNYLQDRQELIDEKQEHNRIVWNSYYCPPVDELMQIIDQQSKRLWEKSPEDFDFLNVRLGIGCRLSELEIKVQEKHFTLEDDILEDKMYELYENKKLIDGVPITVSLRDNQKIAIVGDKSEIRSQIWSIIASLAILHSSDEIRLVFIVDPIKAMDYEWVLSLPHIHSADQKFSYFATTNEEVRKVFIKLHEDNIQTDVDDNIHHIVFILNDKLIEDLPLDVLLTNQTNNFTLIYASEYFKHIPKECKSKTMIISEQGSSGLYQKSQNDNRVLPFRREIITDYEVQKIRHFFSNIEIPVLKSQRPIPDSVTFLSMYQVGNIKGLQITNRWMNSKISRSMAAPIGIKQGEEVFALDIHEKYHGCHGLVAGTTGSGKSEFLQEYILSMMLNYNPHQIAFILIDFKGGDMARPFKNSPHLAASISNLSGAMLYRARVSLEAEIKRRQEMFNSVSRLLGVDKLDINSYHKYFESGKVKEPLPHLIIIIDEFAQLKTQQPDFLSYLVDVAQVGRSLGIHLILATQKPSGVVSPQIWSNSRFKVCLKVLDTEDSKEMIRRPIAANIKQPGRAYVQVGYDEVFEQVQTGYSGADYVEHDHFLEEGEDSIEMVDYTSSPFRDARNSVKGLKSGRTQLEETMSEIVKVGEKLHMVTKPLWLPVLENNYYLEEILESKCIFKKENWDLDRKLSCILGISDIPSLQKQPLYEIDFIRNGHLAIYGTSGTGKTSMIQSLLLAMSLKYSPEMFQCFILDFGGRNLTRMAMMPHCQEIAFDGEDEKIDNIFLRIHNILEERKMLFAKAECATYESYLEITGKKLPGVIFVIDNYASFRNKIPMYEDDVIEFVANAKAYGVYLIITGNSRNAIYYKVSEHIMSKVVFFMNDTLVYKELLMTREKLELEDIKGRALTKLPIRVEEIKDGKKEEKLVEMIAEVHIALPYNEMNENKMSERMKNEFVAMQEACPNMKKYSPVFSSGSDESKEPGISTMKRNYKPSTDSRRKKPMILPEIEVDNNNHLLLGYATFDHRPQGFNLVENKSIAFFSNNFISLESQAKRLYEQSVNNLYYFTLRDDVDTAGQIMNTEEDISFFIDSYEFLLEEVSDHPETSVELSQKMVVFIEDFSDFYDTISDEDLRRLVQLYRKDSSNVLITLSSAILNKIVDYIDTELYIKWMKQPVGVIEGGNVEDQYLNCIHNDFSYIPANVRQRVLPESQSLLYMKTEVSIVDKL